MRCFYDADEEIELWGKYLAEELPAIHGEQAAAVVVFVSADHAARDWTRLERQAALGRAVRERREYVLPARFDDSPLPRLLADMVTIDLRIRTAHGITARLTRIAHVPVLTIEEPTAGPDPTAISVDPDLNNPSLSLDCTCLWTPPPGAPPEAIAGNIIAVLNAIRPLTAALPRH